MAVFKTCFVLLTFLIAGVTSQAQSPGGGTLVIKSGEKDVTVPKNAKKVVILDHSILETFLELDIPVAGVTNTVPDHLAAYRDGKYAKLGTLTKPDIQAIAALKPDLIISGGRQRDYFDSLTTIAPTVTFAVDYADFLESFEASVYTIASLYGKEKLAKEKLDLLHEKIEQVKKKTAADQHKALFVLHVADRFGPNGPKTRFGFGYDVLGLQAAYDAPPATTEPRRNRSAQTTEGAQTPNPERPKQPSPDQINPDYLFIIDRATAIEGTVPPLADLLTDEIKATAAFKNNKVFVLPGAFWYLAGSGLISVDKKITDIGTMLYGIKF